MRFSWCKPLRDCLCALEKFVFKVKKLSIAKKKLEVVRKEAPNRRNRLSLQKKCVATVVRPPLKAYGSLLMHSRRCFASIHCLAALLLTVSRWELHFVARQHTHLCRHFPCGKIAVCWQIENLLTYSPPWARWIRQLGLLQVIGPLKKTIWHLQAAKVRQWCCETATCAGRAWRRSLPLVAVIVSSSHATVLGHQLK